jgi:exonuclease SbcC
MRPRSLEVEGFTAFREKVVVDFDGLDLFAITGPTGAGKSSLLDAAILALFGQVPRVSKEYKQLISHGAERMSVRLDFSVGERAYRIARTIRKQGTPASRLERLEDGRAVPMADRAADVAREVERLLGLDYDAFVRSVVLPQGQFDEFLKGKPEERRRILVALLNLDVYQRMQRLANEQATAARREAEFLAQELAKTLAGATPEAVERKRAEAEAARDAQARAEASLAALDSLAGQAQELRDARREAERLTREMDAEAERAEMARHALAGAEEQRRVLAEERERAQVRLAAAAFDPERHLRLTEARPRLERLVAAGERALRLERDAARQARALRQRKEELEHAAAAVPGAARAFEAARVALQAAEDARAAAHARHAAHALRRQLKKGEPCPVCERPVAKLPRAASPAVEASEAELARARGAHESARQAAEQARLAAERAAAEARRAQEEAERLETERAHALREMAELEQALGAALPEPAPASAAERLRRVSGELTQLEAVRTERQRLGDALRRIEARAAQHEADVAGARASVERALERLQDLSERRGQATAREQALRAALSEAAVAAGAQDLASPPAGRDALDVVELHRGRLRRKAQEAAAHAARLGGEAERLERDATRAAELAGRKAGLERDAGLFGTLAQLLRADQFLAYVQEEALEVLADDASRHLLALSQGRYALLWRDQDFTVEDRWNGNETRSAKTLSGGESFQASLALALALAERVAELSAEGRASDALESLFLDEGFGSLDAEALDHVVAALDHLHGGKRVVGVVTHIQSLAERLPARIEVRRAGSASQVSVV